MKSWPNMKLGQVQVGSNISRNHSSSPWEVIYGHYLPQFTWKVDQKWNYVKFKLVRKLLRITHLAHRKSYLVIICPNSQEKLSKSLIRSNSSRFEHCSESLIWPIGSHIWSLFAPIHMKCWPKVKLGQVIICSNLVLSTLIWPHNTIFVHI